ncbi:MAG: DNA-binding response regulator [Vicinamibacterales bacterium]
MSGRATPTRARGLSTDGLASPGLSDRRRAFRPTAPGRRREDVARLAGLADRAGAGHVRVALRCRAGLFAATLAESLARCADLIVCEPADAAGMAGADWRTLPVVVAELDRFLQEPQAFLSQGSHARLLLLASATSSAQVLAALQQGAWGVVRFDAHPDELLTLIRAAGAGQAWDEQRYAGQFLKDVRRDGAVEPPVSRPVVLTPRELQVVAALVDGASNAAIAGSLGLRPQTIKNRLSTIFDKVGVSSRLELALYAVHHRLTDLRTR